jgi:hypothetical protein
MVTNTPTALHLTAWGSTGATIVSFTANWLPVFQAAAAIIAVISGTVSLYLALKRNKKNG